MTSPDTQRQVAVDCFNKAWALMEKQDGTRDDDDEMLHCAHASAYHWHQVGAAANRARAEWQCSRVYAILGRAEPRYVELGREATAKITDEDDRRLMEADLATIGP